jgi:hypothetical protein
LSTSAGDIVLSADAAQRVLEANKEGHFLWRWAVTVLID